MSGAIRNMETSETMKWSSILESKTQSEREAHLEMLTRNLAAMEAEVKNVRESVLESKKSKETILLKPFPVKLDMEEKIAPTEEINKESSSPPCSEPCHFGEESTDEESYILTAGTSTVPRTKHVVSAEETEETDEEVRSNVNENEIGEELKNVENSIPPTISDDNSTTANSITTISTIKVKTHRKPRTTRLGDRSGKWTTEEEEYARYLIECFDKGILRGPEKGTSLRSYLAKVLNCDPMRISKKYVGMMRIGKRFYRRSLSFDAEARTEIASRNLELLRRRWEMREQYRCEDRSSGFPPHMYREMNEFSPLSLAPRFDTSSTSSYGTSFPYMSQQQPSSWNHGSNQPNVQSSSSSSYAIHNQQMHPAQHNHPYHPHTDMPHGYNLSVGGGASTGFNGGGPSQSSFVTTLGRHPDSMGRFNSNSGSNSPNSIGGPQMNGGSNMNGSMSMKNPFDETSSLLSSHYLQTSAFRQGISQHDSNQSRNSSNNYEKDFIISMQNGQNGQGSNNRSVPSFQQVRHTQSFNPMLSTQNQRTMYENHSLPQQSRGGGLPHHPSSSGSERISLDFSPLTGLSLSSQQALLQQMQQMQSVLNGGLSWNDQNMPGGLQTRPAMSSMPPCPPPPCSMDQVISDLRTSPTSTVDCEEDVVQVDRSQPQKRSVECADMDQQQNNTSGTSQDNLLSGLAPLAVAAAAVQAAEKSAQDREDLERKRTFVATNNKRSKVEIIV